MLVIAYDALLGAPTLRFSMLEQELVQLRSLDDGRKAGRGFLPGLAKSTYGSNPLPAASLVAAR